VNPKYVYNNPIGLYCYPLIPKIFEQLISGTLPFAQGYPYILIFKINNKPNKNIIESIEFGEEDLNKFKNYILSTEEGLTLRKKICAQSCRFRITKFYFFCRKKCTYSK